MNVSPFGRSQAIRCARYPVASAGSRNYEHDEMLYVFSSTGSVFEERSKQLKNEPDIVEAIIKHGKRMFGENGRKGPE